MRTCTVEVAMFGIRMSMLVLDRQCYCNCILRAVSELGMPEMTGIAGS